MAVSVQVSEVIDRPAADVFRFYAIDHVSNHPRWDPNMQLDQVTDGPIGVGTIIKRVNSRSGQPVEGTMEVVEFEMNRAMTMIIHDGSIEMRGRASLEAEGDAQTKLIFDVEFPSMDESMDTSLLASQMQQSLRNIKEFVESDA
jgi:hypothetical protein